MTSGFEEKLLRWILNRKIPSPFIITVVSVVVSELVFSALFLLKGQRPPLDGFIISFLVPVIVAYPASYFSLKLVRIVQGQNLEIEQKNHLKNTLLSVVSHDVKGPLMNMDSILELYFMKEIQAHELDELLHELQLQVKTNLDFVMNILQWTKTQFDGFQIKKEEVDLLNIVERIEDAYHYQLQQKALTIDHVANVRVVIDKDLGQLILRNLISNAIKYSNPGGKISVRAEVKNNVFVCSVADTGMGIDPKKLADIFNVSMLKSSRGTLKETGTGLGLKLCKIFVDAQGGDISVESEPGKGSVFSFSIPQ